MSNGLPPQDFWFQTWVERMKKTWFFSFFIAAGFLLILNSYSLHWSWSRFAVVVILMLPAPRLEYRFLALIIITFISKSFDLFAVHASSDPQNRAVTEFTSHLRFETRWSTLVTFGLIFAFASFAVLAAYKFLQKRETKRCTQWTFALAAATVLGALAFNDGREFVIWIAAAALAICACTLPLAHVLLKTNTDRPFGTRSGLAWGSATTGLLQTFFTGIAFPLLRVESLRLIESFHAATPEEIARTRWKALKLLFVSRLTFFIGEVVDAFFFNHSKLLHPYGLPSLSWPNYNYLGHQAYNAAHVPVWESWIVVLLNCALSLILNVGYLGRTVAYLRLSGLWLRRPTYRIFQCENFNDYFKRNYHYYCRTLSDLFFYGTWDRLRIFSLKSSAHLAWTLFFTVFLGSLSVHALMEVPYVFEYGLKAYTLYLIGHLPYFFALATACAVTSSAVSGQRIVSRWAQTCCFARAFTLHAILLTLVDQSPLEGWSDRWVFLKSLIGG